VIGWPLCKAPSVSSPRCFSHQLAQLRSLGFAVQCEVIVKDVHQMKSNALKRIRGSTSSQDSSHVLHDSGMNLLLVYTCNNKVKCTLQESLQMHDLLVISSVVDYGSACCLPFPTKIPSNITSNCDSQSCTQFSFLSDLQSV
jgi:hypothetical protein